VLVDVLEEGEVAVFKGQFVPIFEVLIRIDDVGFYAAEVK